GRGADQVGVLEGGAVNAHLVRAGRQDAAEVVHVGDTAADGKGDEDLLSDAGSKVKKQTPLLVRGGDVQEDQVGRPPSVVGGGERDRIASIAQALEVDALDDAALLHIETGDNPAGQHGNPHCNTLEYRAALPPHEAARNRLFSPLQRQEEDLIVPLRLLAAL